jgi:hypothetical protein
LVVQNFENWLVAIGRLFDATKEHDETAQMAAAKDALELSRLGGRPRKKERSQSNCFVAQEYHIVS